MFEIPLLKGLSRAQVDSIDSHIDPFDASICPAQWETWRRLLLLELLSELTSEQDRRALLERVAGALMGLMSLGLDPEDDLSTGFSGWAECRSWLMYNCPESKEGWARRVRVLTNELREARGWHGGGLAPRHTRKPEFVDLAAM
jgi:hypothetical protein